jgi:hypothetical protein
MRTRRNLDPGDRDMRVQICAAFVSLIASIVLAACGASGKPSGSAPSNSQLALAQCMRSHGVPNFPDPTKGPAGEGFSISSTPGSSTLTVDTVTFSGPAFVSAEKTCKLFGGGTAPPPISESQKLAAFHFAQCMRKHGVPSYPDPTFPAGGGIDRGNTPAAASPAVKRAASVCSRGH